MHNDAMIDSSLQMPEKVSSASRESYLSLLRSSLSAASSEMVVECGSVDTVTSTHIGLLWETKQICEECGVAFRLNHVSEAMYRVLRVMDLDGVFEDTTAATPAPSPGSRPRPVTATSEYADTIHASHDGVQDALARFIIWLADLGLVRDDAYQLQTVFYEVAVNIALHGGMSESSSFSVSAIAGPNDMVLEFRDRGTPFDPTAVPHCEDFRAAAKRSAIRGLGIGMVHRLVDQIEYHHDNGTTNILSLTKKWSPNR